MVALVGDTIDKVLRKYQEMNTPDVLRTAMDDVQTSLSFQGFLPSWSPGQVVSIGTERLIVTAVNRDNNIADVVRGWENTTPIAHSISTPIVLDPRGNRSETLDHINDCLHDLYPDLYKVESTEITYNASKIGYEIPTDATRILRVTARFEASSSLWEPVHDWYIEDEAADEFTTGRAIMFRVSLPAGALFRIKYGTSFTPITSESDDLEALSGLRPYMIDLLYYFALSRIMLGDEQRRSQSGTAVNHQRAGDIPPFTAMRTGEWYYARYLERKVSAIKAQAFEHKESLGTGYGS